MNTIKKPHKNLLKRRSRKKANERYTQLGWLVGCNYTPSTASNQIEMRQKAAFDPVTIDRELGRAEELGFNTIRVFLHNLVRDDDPTGYSERIDHFLRLAENHRIRVMFVFFDSVRDPHPHLGRQKEPLAWVHNSRRVQSPWYVLLNNPALHDSLYSYVTGVVSQFKDDPRVLMRDLYNEPDNTNVASYQEWDTDHHIIKYTAPKAELALALLQKTVQRIRALNPSQPITMGPRQRNTLDDLSEIDTFMFEQSDIISFHNYEGHDRLQQRITTLKAFGRPLLCTEYMARGEQSTFHDNLPMLKKFNVGAYNRGFVQGKSQTHCPRNTRQAPCAEPELRFHDILHQDGRPYNHEEVAFLKKFCANKTLKWKRRKAE